MAQNGYINFGKLFGGLIVQWGFATVSMNQQATTFTYPIALTNAWVGFTQQRQHGKRIPWIRHTI